MKKVRAFFLRRQLREKVLLLGFVALIVIVWSSELVDRVTLRAREISQTSLEIKIQREWLAKAQEIESAAKAALENWDPNKTYNAVKLNAEISSIANAVGFKRDYTLDMVSSQRSTEFARFHSVQFNANRADYFMLEKFYHELVKRAPYIGLERFILQADRNTGATVNARILITSVELVR